MVNKWCGREKELLMSHIWASDAETIDEQNRYNTEAKDEKR